MVLVGESLRRTSPLSPGLVPIQVDEALATTGRNAKAREPLILNVRGYLEVVGVKNPPTLSIASVSIAPKYGAVQPKASNARSTSIPTTEKTKHDDRKPLQGGELGVVAEKAHRELKTGLLTINNRKPVEGLKKEKVHVGSRNLKSSSERERERELGSDESKSVLSLPAEKSSVSTGEKKVTAKAELRALHSSESKTEAMPKFEVEGQIVAEEDNERSSKAIVPVPPQVTGANIAKKSVLKAAPPSRQAQTAEKKASITKVVPEKKPVSTLVRQALRMPPTFPAAKGAKGVKGVEKVAGGEQNTALQAGRINTRKHEIKPTSSLEAAVKLAETCSAHAEDTSRITPESDFPVLVADSKLLAGNLSQPTDLPSLKQTKLEVVPNSLRTSDSNSKESQSTDEIAIETHRDTCEGKLPDNSQSNAKHVTQKEEFLLKLLEPDIRIISSTGTNKEVTVHAEAELPDNVLRSSSATPVATGRARRRAVPAGAVGSKSLKMNIKKLKEVPLMKRSQAGEGGASVIKDIQHKDTSKSTREESSLIKVPGGRQRNIRLLQKSGADPSVRAVPRKDREGKKKVEKVGKVSRKMGEFNLSGTLERKRVGKAPLVSGEGADVTAIDSKGKVLRRGIATKAGIASVERFATLKKRIANRGTKSMKSPIRSAAKLQKEEPKRKKDLVGKAKSEVVTKEVKEEPKRKKDLVGKAKSEVVTKEVKKSSKRNMDKADAATDKIVIAGSTTKLLLAAAAPENVSGGTSFQPIETASKLEDASSFSVVLSTSAMEDREAESIKKSHKGAEQEEVTERNVYHERDASPKSVHMAEPPIDVCARLDSMTATLSPDHSHVKAVQGLRVFEEAEHVFHPPQSRDTPKAAVEWQTASPSIERSTGLVDGPTWNQAQTACRYTMRTMPLPPERILNERLTNPAAQKNLESHAAAMLYKGNLWLPPFKQGGSGPLHSSFRGSKAVEYIKNLCCCQCSTSIPLTAQRATSCVICPGVLFPPKQYKLVEENVPSAGEEAHRCKVYPGIESEVCT